MKLVIDPCNSYRMAGNRTSRWICLLVLLFLPAAVEAQSLPQECQRIADAIAALESEKEEWAAKLRSAPGSGKGDLVRIIRNLNRQIDARKRELRTCRQGHGLPTDLLRATFVGTATLRTSNSDAPGPFLQPVNIGLEFGVDRRNIYITRFPAIRVSYNTRVGRVTTTVTKTGVVRGSFGIDTGAVSVSITLHFHHSHPLAGDSDVEFNLTTGRARRGAFDNTGSPLAADGSITVVGASSFSGGYLNGDECSLVIRGAVSPRP